MNLKNTFLEFGNTYQKIRIETIRLLNKVKPKVQEIADAQIVQSLREKRDFYWKHDLPIIKGLANKYNINISKLDKLCKKYLEIEQKLLKKKENFAKLGLRDITFGPKSISAYGGKNSQIYIYIDVEKNDLEIRIHIKDEDIRLAEDFEKFTNGLKVRIQNLLQQDII